jgi:spore maturation protein SpmB
VLAYILGLTAMITATIWYFMGLPQEQVQTLSNLIANLILFGVISSFILLGLVRRINVYEVFIEGAKEGFNVAIRIIPYLVAVLVAIGVLRASGTLDFLVAGLGNMFAAMGLDTRFVPALPTAMMKPLSGSGARGMMVDAMNTHGADSFVGRLASIVQGTSDTTFYILALYFGSVGIKKTRHAVACGLLADLVGIIAAIFVAYLFFG